MDLNVIYHSETEITLITIIWIQMLLRFTINLRDCICFCVFYEKPECWPVIP